MNNTERIDYLECLEGMHKVKVVLWSSFARKRFYVFETLWNRGMATRFAYRDANKMSFKEVKNFWIKNHVKPSK